MFWVCRMQTSWVAVGAFLNAASQRLRRCSLADMPWGRPCRAFFALACMSSALCSKEMVPRKSAVKRLLENGVFPKEPIPPSKASAHARTALSTWVLATLVTDYSWVKYYVFLGFFGHKEICHYFSRKVIRNILCYC